MKPSDNYPGKQIGDLRLLRMVRGKKWECLCSLCGSYVELTDAQLNTKRNCGCKKNNKIKEITQQEQEALDLGFQRLAYSILRYAANDYTMLKERNLKRRWIKDCGTPALSELKEFIDSDWCKLLTDSISVTI